MENKNEEILLLESHYRELYSLLINLNDENFDNSLEKVKISVENINAIQKNSEVLEKTKNNPSIKKIAKLIEESFDNAVARKKEEINLTGARLFALQNQKKLTTYFR